MTAHGGPEVLEVQEIERPVPAPDEVLIKLVAAGVNPVDTQVRAGSWVPEEMGEPPTILGWDLAGTVAELGEEVSGFERGDQVFGMPRFPGPGRCDAEYVVAFPDEIARAPEALTDEQAGALPLAGLTAWQALVDTAEIGEGDRVVVQAAAGGVGHLAVQIAKARGAHVIGTARAEKHAFLRGLGVDHPIDYTDVPFEAEAGEVDVVLDLIGNEDYARRSLRCLHECGLLIE